MLINSNKSEKLQISSIALVIAFELFWNYHTILRFFYAPMSAEVIERPHCHFLGPLKLYVSKMTQKTKTFCIIISYVDFKMQPSS